MHGIVGERLDCPPAEKHVILALLETLCLDWFEVGRECGTEL
jgi:hypothetical protein